MGLRGRRGRRPAELSGVEPGELAPVGRALRRQVRVQEIRQVVDVPRAEQLVCQSHVRAVGQLVGQRLAPPSTLLILFGPQSLLLLAFQGVGKLGRVPEGAQRDGDGQKQTGRQRGSRRGVAAHPTGRAARDRRRPGVDRLPGPPSPQVRGQGLGGIVALVRFFSEALEADRFQIARRLAVERARRHRFLLAHLSHGLQGRGRLERRPARQALVQDGPQRVDVRRAADLPRPPVRLFRRHVARRPQQHAGRRSAALVKHLGEAEVADFGRTVLGE